MPRCLVSLGSNLGDRDAAIHKAVTALQGFARGGSLRVSGSIDSPPVGGPQGQQGFRNAVAVFETDERPEAVLARLQRLESEAERERTVRWAARTLDLDLLLYGEEVIRTPELRVPHPRMTFRPFVLGPACEVAGEMRHPECVVEPGCASLLNELWDVLRWGNTWVGLVDEHDPEISTWIQDARPGLRTITIEPGTRDSSTSQLTIDKVSPPGQPARYGPRLVLADCPREHWRDEVLAALECVWPVI